MDNTVRKALGELGCSENEIITFLALLMKNSGVSALKLSQELNLPRPTVYGHLDTLQEKGLVKKGLSDSGSLFYAESLEAVSHLFDEKIRSVSEAKKSIKELEGIQGIRSDYNPKFILYNKKNAAEQILKDILRSQEKDIYWFWPVKEMLKVIPKETLIAFHEERIKRGIWMNMLWPEKKRIDIRKIPSLGPADREKSLRRIRILPEKIDYAMGYGIYGNKMGFISSRRENYGFIIDSKEMTQALKSQFDFLWNVSKNYI